MFILPMLIILLILVVLIASYNWVYRKRIDALKHQLGLELPEISLTIMRIGMYFAFFSAGIIMLFIIISR